MEGACRDLEAATECASEANERLAEVASLLRTHAQLAEDVAKASVSAARELIVA